jgi:hypothetical protein
MNGKESKWLTNRYGQPKIAVSDALADKFIAAGVATEDDLLRTKPLPLGEEDSGGEE